MAQTNYTPISLYYSTTASQAPSAGNLVSGELAINITDGKLYYKDNGGVVQIIAGKGGAGVAAGSNTQVQFNNSGAFGASSNLTWDGTTLAATKFSGALNGTVGATTPNTGAFTTLDASGNVTLSGGTANGVLYLNGSKVATSGSAFVFDGTNVGIGTSSPARKLQVNSSEAVAARFTRSGGIVANNSLEWFDGTNGWYAGVSGGNFFGVAYNSSGSIDSAALRIDSSGNLGLGVTPSGWGSPFASGVLEFSGGFVTGSSANNATRYGLNSYYNGSSYIYKANGYATGYAQNGQHQWFIAPSGTAGNAITFTQAMTLDASGNLGIGTSSPAFSLDISAAAPRIRQTATTGTNSSLIQLVNTGGTAYIGLDNSAAGVSAAYALALYHSGAYPITFSTSGTERARITSGGDFCIGSSSPGNAGTLNLSVGNPGTTAGGLQLWSTTTGTHYVQFGDSASGGATYSGALGYSHTSDVMLFLTNQAERMRLDSSGNLGLGVTPSASATFKAMQIGPNLAALYLASSGGDAVVGDSVYYNAGWKYAYSGIAVSYYEQTAGVHKWFSYASGTSGTGLSGGAGQAMTLDTSGNLLVGTTTSSGKLTVTSSTASATAVNAIMAASGDAGYAGLLVQKYDNNSTTAQVFVQFGINAGGGTSGQINANGANAAAFGAWSDRRLKTNIVDLPPQLDNILALRPVEFDYIESEGGGHQIGFIAQDMQLVYPEVVGERIDGMLTVTGWSKTEARIVKAIQELKAEIDSLKTQLKGA